MRFDELLESKSENVISLTLLIKRQQVLWWRAEETRLPKLLAMAERGKTQTGGGRRPNARYAQKAKQKWKAATPGLETAVFGYGATYTPDTFTKAYSSLTKYIGAGNLDKKGGPDAAKALRKFSAPEFKAPTKRKDEPDKIAEIFYKK